MSTRQRAIDRGHQRAAELRRSLGIEIRNTRRSHGLSCRVVGLELAAKAHPANADALRDAGQARVLGRLAARIAPSLAWRIEVPLPIPGDRRAWDATVTAADRSWRYGVEAEARPSDGQQIVRRLSLKQRDGGVDEVILLLPDTHRSRAFLRQFGPLLRSEFHVPGQLALRRLESGEDPQGSAVVVL